MTARQHGERATRERAFRGAWTWFRASARIQKNLFRLQKLSGKNEAPPSPSPSPSPRAPGLYIALIRGCHREPATPRASTGRPVPVRKVTPFRAALGASPRARRGAVAVRAEASGSSYYKVVNGVKLDRKVVDDATEFQANNGTIDKDEAQRIFLDIVDGPKRAVGGANETMTTVTNVELDTAQYIYENFQWDEDAKEWFYKELTSKNW